MRKYSQVYSTIIKYRLTMKWNICFEIKFSEKTLKLSSVK